MLSYFAGEVEEGIVLHPVVVVHQLGGVGRVAVEVEEVGELCLDAGHVVAQNVLGEQVALCALARGVANHARCAANEGEGLMAAPLEVAEHHHTAEVSDVQGVGRGVDAHVSRCHALRKHFFCARHHLVYHAAPFEFFYEIHIIFLN